MRPASSFSALGAQPGEPFASADGRYSIKFPGRPKVAPAQTAKSAIGYARLDGATDVAKVSVIGIGMRSHAGVAAQAFEDLSLKLEAAMKDRAPRDALRGIAFAYLGFGQADMEVYRLMFASRLTPQAASEGDLNRASNAAFALLRTAVAAVSTSGSVDDDAYSLWGQLHGLVMLKADGFITSPLERFADSLFRKLPALRSLDQ